MVVFAILALAGCGGRVEEVRDMVEWDPTCADVVVHHRHFEWPHADEFAYVECEHLGPTLQYARFADQAELQRDLLAESPSRAVCLAGLRARAEACP